MWHILSWARQTTYQVYPASRKKVTINVFCCIHMFKLIIVVLGNIRVTDASEKGQTDAFEIDGQNYQRHNGYFLPYSN